MSAEQQIEALNSAETLYPIRYVAVDTGGSADPVDKVLTNLIEKVDAGAQLAYALYFHPKAKELFSSEFMSLGLQKAYMRACDAFDIRSS